MIFVSIPAIAKTISTLISNVADIARGFAILVCEELGRQIAVVNFEHDCVCDLDSIYHDNSFSLRVR